MHTVNDQLSSLGAYLKIKHLGCALIWTGQLIGCGHLIKICQNIGTISCILNYSHFKMKLKDSGVEKVPVNI